MQTNSFLPITKQDMQSRGIDVLDFIYVCGDAYVDYPSFGAAIITRYLESLGYTVGIIAQPDWKNTDDIKRLGKPRLGFLVSSGNIDSMVAHYTVSKKKRNYDYYSPDGKTGYRPDRAVIVYCNLIRQSYGDVPVIIGGLEASLRRFAHYDYWDDKVRRSILVDSKADILSYGMGEKSIAKIAELLSVGVSVKKIRSVRGTAVLCEKEYLSSLKESGYVICGSYEELKQNKEAYAKAFKIQYEENDYINGRIVIEDYGDKILVQNPPFAPLEEKELDKVYALPYMRNFHPVYDNIPAVNEVKFSITHSRGCFGGCNFCALAFHQGRSVRSRSVKSVVREAEIISNMPDFEGYIHDIGGPTANFRKPSCQMQLKDGMCKNKRCLAPNPCRNLEIDHGEYMKLIEAVEALPKVKKVFIRSGIRFDYLMLDKSETGKAFFNKLVRDNISGQLKVAPEHISDNVLEVMGKSKNHVYEKFCEEYFYLCEKHNKEQYLVPYLMSSHPGSTINDAIKLAVYLKNRNYWPEQVQDFYPTPGTASTCMFYTGIDPFTGRKVYIPEAYEEKKMQRALLQSGKPENYGTVLTALIKAHREDLIGFGKDCLIKPNNKNNRNSKVKR
ncbi:MAG: YgiQ family radical SAM protein [Oscillospiraceae bacterium]|nr:YgiQ family radical SAM protein [Oscillospiraceae bacterium]